MQRGLLLRWSSEAPLTPGCLPSDLLFEIAARGGLPWARSVARSRRNAMNGARPDPMAHITTGFCAAGNSIAVGCRQPSGPDPALTWPGECGFPRGRGEANRIFKDPKENKECGAKNANKQDTRAHGSCQIFSLFETTEKIASARGSVIGHGRRVILGSLSLGC